MTSTRFTTPIATPVFDASRLSSIGGGAKVVLYTSSDCWRGAGISFVAIARGLAAYGFRPHVVTLCDEVTHEFVRAGISTTQLPRGRGESQRLRRFLRVADARVVLVDRAHDLRVGTLATMGTRAKLLYRYNHFGRTPPTDALTRIAYHVALSGQVFLSSSARTKVLEEIPFMRRVAPTTIHEGVDASLFRPNRRAAVEFRRARRLGSEPFLLAVGALSAEKRYPFLFDALRLLSFTAPRLIVCGEGGDEPDLRARAASLGLEVRFEGRIPQRELIGAYNACTALIHAGSVETFGLAVLEAMSCARPVIAAAGGALPEVVGTDGSCGVLFPPGSAWDMADTILRTLADSDRCAAMGASARERARQEFSVASMERAYAWFVARHSGFALHARTE